MTIKKSTLYAFLVCTLLMMTSTIYAEISIDDMDSLLKDDSLVESDIGSAGENERKSDRSNDSASDKTGSTSDIVGKSGGISIQSSLAITVVVAVFAVIFIGVIFFLYAKTKKLVDDAQISKDLAEKYFYNVQEYKESFERIKREIDLSITSIDKGIENIDKEIDTKVGEKLNGLDKMLAIKVSTILDGIGNRDIKPDEPEHIPRKAVPPMDRDDTITIMESLQMDEFPSSETISEPLQNDDKQFLEPILEPLQEDYEPLPKAYEKGIQDSINDVSAILNESAVIDETVENEEEDNDEDDNHTDVAADQPRIFWRNNSTENTDDECDIEVAIEEANEDEFNDIEALLRDGEDMEDDLTNKNNSEQEKLLLKKKVEKVKKVAKAKKVKK